MVVGDALSDYLIMFSLHNFLYFLEHNTNSTSNTVDYKLIKQIESYMNAEK